MEDNNHNNSDLTEEQKRFGRAYLPNDPDFAEDWDEKIKDDKTKAASNDNNDKNGNSQNKEKQSKAELVIPHIKPHIHQLFTDEYVVPHAGIKIDNHTEVLRLDSRRFRNWMSRKLWHENGTVVDSSTLKDIIGILSAQAEFESPSVKLSLRTADIDNAWYYDLTNKNWEFIQISSEGWYTVSNSVIFRRYSPTPQVYPWKEYAPDIFDRFIDLLNINNPADEVKNKETRLLLKCYIISLFIPDVPKVILMLHGEQGSAKTTLGELIRALVDPSIVRTFSFPEKINEFIQQLAHNYVTCYDNISGIKDWISDLLCRAVTGSGFSKRQLYTDDEDFIYSLKRCIIINGIILAATKPDLLDSGLIIQLHRIAKDKWRKIQDVWNEFEEIKPQLISYIFDILVKVLLWKKDNASVDIELFRMADWAECCEIIARCMGYKPLEFVNAYKNNIGIQSEEVINSSPVATALIHFMHLSDDSDLKSTATHWLKLLTEEADEMGINIRDRSMPKSASHLSRKLRELVTTLRDIGIILEWEVNTKTKSKSIRITKGSEFADTTVSVDRNKNQAQNSMLDEETGVDRNDRNGTLGTFEGEESDSGQQEEPQRCPDCHRTIDPFDKNTHPACCQGKGPA